MAVKLNATQREDLSRSKIKGLREEGQVPAVVYGKDKETHSVAVSSIELLKTLRDEGRNAVITLDVEGKSSVDVMLQDYQMDPIRDTLIHVDFYVVDMTEAREVSVAVNIEGEAAGTKEGGTLQQPLWEVLISVKPGDIPEGLTVDVTELEIGDTITVADLPKSDKYEFLDEEDSVVVTIVPPAAEEEETDADDAPAEPEVINQKDNEEEA